MRATLVMGLLMLIACAAPVATKSTIACDNDGAACPEQKAGTPVTNKPGTSSELPVTPVVVERAPPNETAPVVDAGVDSGPAIGPSCTALKACCENLRKAGITGSANQCDTVVTDANEVSCSSVNEDYKTPGETYDPVCF